jgi:hypothetical protein
MKNTTGSNLSGRLGAGIAGLAIVSGVGLLSACGVPAATLDDDVAVAASTAVTQDDPNGCQQVGNPTDGNAGWICTYVGQNATITVPAGVTGMRLSLTGGQGGNADPASGGDGALAAGTWSATPGQLLTVTVGQAAVESTLGWGAASGADPGCGDGGAGAGASAVAVNGTTLAVASGGGGGGAQGLFPGTQDGGAGGTSTVNGGKGSNGKGVGAGSGGAGGTGASFAPATRGGHGHDGGGCGGGGGGGWGGGNGGNNGGLGGGGGAGGGAGSDYFAPGGSGTSVGNATNGGNGQIDITWI